MSQSLKDVADFVVRHAGYFNAGDEEQIEQYLKVHAKFGTLIVVRDQGHVIAVCRWNWLDPHTVDVLDLVIHPQWRKPSMVRSILLRAKSAYPSMLFMVYKREKYNNREKAYDILRFLKLEKAYVK